MEEITISKRCFYEWNPDSHVKKRVMEYVVTDIKLGNKNLTRKYSYFYKYAVVPVLMLFVGIWWYFVFTTSSSTSLDTQIVQTQNAINELVAMNDYEIY